MCCNTGESIHFQTKADNPRGTDQSVAAIDKLHHRAAGATRDFALGNSAFNRRFQRIGGILDLFLRLRILGYLFSKLVGKPGRHDSARQHH